MKDQNLDEDLYLLWPVTLWVEEHLTQVFLTELWQDKDIKVRAGGGREGVKHFMSCVPASRRGRSIVGLVDRDFSSDNSDHWHDPQIPILRRHAMDLVWWMACKSLLNDAYLAFTENFPREAAAPPSENAPKDADAAADHLLSSKFWKRDGRLAHRTWTESYVRDRVRDLGDDYRRQIEGDAWLSSFSGKEIFRFLRSHVPALRALRNDEDLARKLARIVRGTPSSTCAPLIGLCAVLRARAGLRRLG